MAPVGEAGTIVGTPAFAAPEVLTGVALDGRADLFSFGATLYFALTGQPPGSTRSPYWPTGPRSGRSRE
jgi:serine/threonine protein kinase, bacterial